MGGGERGGGEEPTPGDGLPDAVRQWVVAAASALLGSLSSAEIPPPLRRIAQFAPARRARVGATMIMDALETDALLRLRTGEAAAGALPALAAAVRARDVPLDADPVEVASLAYLLRPDGWSSVVGTAAEQLERRATEEAEARRGMTAERLAEQLSALRATARDESANLRAELDAARAENTRLRQRLGAAREEARAAGRTVEAAEARSRAVQVDGAAAVEAELRRLRGRLLELEHALEAARRSARDGRATESMRTRLLVDTLVDVGLGLRRELALPPLHTRPADLVTGTAAPLTAPGSRGRDTDDPALLEQLLAVPQVHLVVDGYNVTKSGYGELPLERQRTRLVTALGTLVARTHAETTCVFDGAAVGGPVPAATARGVRVRFSAPGVTADDVIRELVRAEPPGRPLVVVTNDQEILRDVRLFDAWTAGSQALLRMLGGR